MNQDKRKSRNVFNTANEYQNKIILLTFLPTVFIFLVFTIIVFVGNPIITDAIYHQPMNSVVSLINKFTGIIVLAMCLIVIATIAGSFIISHHIVGPFGRIIKELDDVIDGRTDKKITSRPGDDLAKELLKRVNFLIDAYTRQKNQFNKD